jgi:hypothetical protein
MLWSLSLSLVRSIKTGVESTIESVEPCGKDGNPLARREKAAR